MHNIEKIKDNKEEYFKCNICDFQSIYLEDFYTVTWWKNMCK